jgi:hypothetical protein
MNQVIKFPEMRPPKARAAAVPKLPTPAQFRQISPAIIAADPRTKLKPVDRRRRLVWFGAAVGLHAALFLAIWLTPPLRIKWSPSPDAWVPVVSLPAKIPTASVAPAGPVAPAAPAVSAAPAQTVKAVSPPLAPAKSHKVPLPVEGRQERAR